MKRLAAFFASLVLLTVSAQALELPEALTGALADELVEAAEEGELLEGGISYLAALLRDAARETLFDSLRGAVLLMLLALLCGLIEGTESETGGIAARCTGYVGVLGAAMIAAGDLNTLIGLGTQTVEELGTLAKLLLPTVAMAMAAGGCVGTASAWQAGALMLSDAFFSLLRACFLPALYCMIGMAAAGALLEQSGLSRLSDAVRKLAGWALGAALTLFTAFLSLTNVLAGTADRAAVRVGKSVISGAVPIVGSILSDASEAVFAAAHALRGTLGALGICAVLALCLVPLARLALQYLLYRAAAFFCGVVGTETLTGFLSQLSSAFSLMLAITAGAAFVLLVSLLIAMMMVVTV